MSKKEKIPVHRMDDKFSGIYVTPFGNDKPSNTSYERSEPHRHDFYYCVLLEKGTLELDVDFQKIQIDDNMLYLSYPGQIHQVNSAQMESGWYLAFEPSVIEQQLRDILDQSLDIIALSLSIEQTSLFSTYLHQIHSAVKDDKQIFQQIITKNMVTAFIYQIASCHLDAERSGLSRHSVRSVEIAKTFRQLLRRNFKTMKKPFEFAKQMHVTVGYLNDTVKAVTGFPATFWIQQELIREAKKMLYYSHQPIKEIANELGFDDEKYFNRLFSKVVGASPGVFRKNSEMSIPF